MGAQESSSAGRAAPFPKKEGAGHHPRVFGEGDRIQSAADHATDTAVRGDGQGGADGAAARSRGLPGLVFHPGARALAGQGAIAIQFDFEFPLSSAGETGDLLREHRLDKLELGVRQVFEAGLSAIRLSFPLTAGRFG